MPRVSHRSTWNVGVHFSLLPRSNFATDRRHSCNFDSFPQPQSSGCSHTESNEKEPSPHHSSRPSRTAEQSNETERKRHDMSWRRDKGEWTHVIDRRMCAIEDRSVSLTPIKSIFRARRVHSTCHWRGSREEQNIYKKSLQESKAETHERKRQVWLSVLSKRPRPMQKIQKGCGHEDELGNSIQYAPFDRLLRLLARGSSIVPLILFHPFFYVTNYYVKAWTQQEPEHRRKMQSTWMLGGKRKPYAKARWHGRSRYEECRLKQIVH